LERAHGDDSSSFSPSRFMSGGKRQKSYFNAVLRRDHLEPRSSSYLLIYQRVEAAAAATR